MHALASSDQNDGANGQLLRIEGAQVDMIYAPTRRTGNAGLGDSVDATEVGWPPHTDRGLTHYTVEDRAVARPGNANLSGQAGSQGWGIS